MQLRSTEDMSHPARRWLFVGVTLYLAASIIAVLLVDVANVMGSRDALERSTVHPPALWYQLFGEGRVTEFVQWSLLAAFALVSARLAGALKETPHAPAARFWSTMSVLGVLLLIEDAGNPRHQLGAYAEQLFHTHVVGTLAEFLFFLLLGAVAGYGLLLYGAVLRASSRAFRTMVVGVAIYAFVGVMSASRDFFLWYARAGDALRSILGGNPPTIAAFENGWDSADEATSYFLFDYLVEESIELVAVTFLLAAVLTYLHHYRRAPNIADVREGMWNQPHLLSRIGSRKSSSDDYESAAKAGAKRS